MFWACMNIRYLLLFILNPVQPAIGPHIIAIIQP